MFLHRRGKRLPKSPVERRRRQRGIAGFEELLSACRDLSVRLIVCETALRAAGLDASALRTDLALEVGGIVTLLNAADGQLIFV